MNQNIDSINKDIEEDLNRAILESIYYQNKKNNTNLIKEQNNEYNNALQKDLNYSKNKVMKEINKEETIKEETIKEEIIKEPDIDLVRLLRIKRFDKK